MLELTTRRAYRRDLINAALGDPITATWRAVLRLPWLDSRNPRVAAWVITTVGR